MFNFLKKKKPTEIKSYCEVYGHKFKDFPWYIKNTQNEDINRPRIVTNTLEIIEPYVCVNCGFRKDVSLMKRVCTTDKELNKTIETMAKMPEIEDYPKVEDMIHDFLLVDKEYLKIREQLHSEK